MRLPRISSLFLFATFVALSSVQAQTPFLEFHYKFDSAEAPLFDSTGNHADLVLPTNGDPHRLGEDSLIGDDGFSVGLDAPGAGHPTGSYMLLQDAPHPESFSVSLWINPIFTGARQAIFARDTVWWPSPCNFYCLYIDGAQSLVWNTGGDEPEITSEAGIIEEDEIYHLVVTHSDTDGADTGEADRSRIFINGELLAEVEDPTEIPSLDAIADDNDIYRLMWLGTLSSRDGYFGEIDDLQFYSTELTEEQVAMMYADPGSTAFPSAPGDFDGDGELDVDDINLLVQETASMNNTSSFDLNGDSLVDAGDITSWVDLANTWIGDADLDGEFNSADFVVVFTAGEYEDDEQGNSVWSEGDWNGDGDFNSGDFVAAFSAGGYENGPRAAAVPEPEIALPLVLGFVILATRRRRV